MLARLTDSIVAVRVFIERLAWAAACRASTTFSSAAAVKRRSVTVPVAPALAIDSAISICALAHSSEPSCSASTLAKKLSHTTYCRNSDMRKESLTSVMSSGSSGMSKPGRLLPHARHGSAAGCGGGSLDGEDGSCGEGSWVGGGEVGLDDPGGRLIIRAPT